MRFALIAAALCALPMPAHADPTGMCGIEDAAATVQPCPRYLTYDEDGEEVGGAAAQR